MVGIISEYLSKEKIISSLSHVLKIAMGIFPLNSVKGKKKITFGLKLMRECFPKGKIFSENKKIGNCHSRETPLPHPVPGPPVLGASDSIGKP